ncbi:hypothetical protein EDC01DRAFT_339288 [Geopyxis carbonaria]|nr:hypothetical protein EDC01DRAFT_339288 [Geopyxis carbonaria]
MPTIEVLPNTTVASGANWAYTTLPPAHSLSATVLAGTNRGARGRNTNYENTAARQRQINSRISELERDNYREVQIAIPKKEGPAAGRASQRTKQASTQNVRRILASQKTFVNHLADEEALHPNHRSRRASSDPPSDGEGMDIDEMDTDEVMPVGDLEGGAPLGYARSVSRPSERPSRTFCEICGYWGTYRCGKCGSRNCGMECGKIHLETKCNKYYG